MYGRNAQQRILTPSLLLVAALACQSPGPESEIEVGPICPQCGPSSGGETGDFGPSMFDCDPYLMPAELEQAEADGLDVAEFERRLTEPVDLPMRWAPVHEGFEEEPPKKLPTRGYHEYTRLEATVSIDSPLRYRRVQQPRCVNASCPCRHLVEADVSIDMRTLDGAVQATTRGVAAQTLGYQPEIDPYFIYFNTRVDLREVIGTLRFSPPGSSFHGSLVLSARLDVDHWEGQLSFPMANDDHGAEDWAIDDRGAWLWFAGQRVLPVHGVFPRVPQVQAKR